AKTRERKLEVAKKIYDIVVGEYGLAPEGLIYDALTFTLATGDAEWIESGKETIEGIRLIKRELPGVSTILGVSNVSFGLTPDARGVLNSVFLHHCVQAGLDAAIVNPAHIRPYAEISSQERELADDLVFNKAVRHLEQFLEKAEGFTKGKVVLATVYGDVHDIGKSLVNTILSNNGYTVFDLGKQVPVNAILDKAVEVSADAIGLSALLVSTSKQMPLCVQ